MPGGTRRAAWHPWAGRPLDRPIDAPMTSAQPLPSLLAAQKLDQHLVAAIEEFSPPKKEGKPAMRGMQRLANLHETAVGDIDAIADAAADEIVAAKAYAKEAVGKFSQEAQKIRQMADGILAQLGQTSNSAVAEDTRTGDATVPPKVTI